MKNVQGIKSLVTGKKKNVILEELVYSCNNIEKSFALNLHSKLLENNNNIILLKSFLNRDKISKGLVGTIDEIVFLCSNDESVFNNVLNNCLEFLSNCSETEISKIKSSLEMF